jgi:hypothetical protein
MYLDFERVNISSLRKRRIKERISLFPSNFYFMPWLDLKFFIESCLIPWNYGTVESSTTLYSLVLLAYRELKGTVSRDFLPLVFVVNKHLPGLLGVS